MSTLYEEGCYLCDAKIEGAKIFMSEGKRVCERCFAESVAFPDIYALHDLPDSGKRQSLPSGAVRDCREGRGRFDLLPAFALMEVAKHFEAGAKKYGDNNWRKGINVSRYIDSGLRHLMKFMDGQTDENHLVSAAWNLLCAIETREKLPGLNDVPYKYGSEV